MEKRLTLKQMILNKIDNSPRGYATELAKIAGYAKVGGLTKVLDKEEKEFEKFNSIIKIVKYAFGEDEHKIMEQYSTEIDPNNKTSRYMLEYLSCNMLLDSMKVLIDKMSICKNADSREWAKVYSIQYEWKKNYYNLDINSFIKKINETTTSIPELKICLNLLKLYGVYHKKNYRTAYEISKVIEFSLDEIKEEYIQNVYKARFNEPLSFIELRVLNNPEASQKLSNEVIEANIGLSYTAYAHYSIGCSYMFSSYDNSLKYLIESIHLYESAKRFDVVKDIKDKVDIINVIWDKKNEITSIEGWLLSQAKMGKLTNTTIEENKEKVDQPWYLLIKGIINNNCDLLLQSLIEFLRIGDTFLGNLPKIELLKRNYNEDIINSLISLNA